MSRPGGALPAVFLDRDGVVNENRPDHVKCWAEFRFIPGALQALRALARLQVPIVVVTNQAAINRRLVSQDCVEGIHRRMVAQIRRAGAEIAAVLYCPHAPDEGCRCRKPAPGMLLEAATRFNIDLARSVLVGDTMTDMLAGERARCRTVLVLTGRGREALLSLATPGNPEAGAPPAAIANDLASAVPTIEAFLHRAHGGQDGWRRPVSSGGIYLPPPAPLLGDA